MSEFHLSFRAVKDLSDIADFTIKTFGIEQAHRYRDGLNNCFETLTSNPKLGRNATQLAPALRRHEHQSHVVFYMPKDDDILIVRVLHQNMDFKQHIPSAITKRTY